jgi:hypothetical protein
MKKHHLIIKSIIAGLALIWCLCSMSPLAGGNSSQTGNNGIIVSASVNGSGSGSILGKTRANNLVSVYVIAYNPYADSGFADTVIADDSGAYAFSSLVPGSYNIMVKDLEKGTAGFISNIQVTVGVHFSDTLDSLTEPGLLSGTLTARNSITTAFTASDTLLYSIIYLPGTPFSGASDNRGRFLLGEIPAGSYEVRIVPNVVMTINGPQPMKELKLSPTNVTITSGAVTELAQ